LRVLCTCLPGTGHFLPMVPLARALTEAGHTVAFATAGEFGPSVQKAGFTAFPAGVSLPQQLEEAGRRYPEANMPPGKERFEAFVPRMLAGVAAPARAADLVAIIGDWHPDLIVHDETDFGGPIAATKFDIPYADQSVGILRPLGMARLAATILEPLCHDWDIDLGPFGGLFRYLYLDVCPPSLQSPEIQQVPVAHPVHNQSAGDVQDEALPSWFDSLPHRPVVYVSLGTVFNRDLAVFRAILDGLRDEPHTVIVTIGRDNDPAALGAQPDHIHVERFIPQSLILPHCEVVVNQGGTAVLDILGHGLPILVLPQGANQFHNAEMCVAGGVGRRLLPEEVNAAAVRHELSILLDDPRYGERARGVQQEFQAMPGPEEGVRLLEQLERARKPLAGSRASGGH
jgi:UDP:flavonoid glycosyltransferase YjiC (YdhE family)